MFVLVPVRATPVPSVVRGSFVVKFFVCLKTARARLSRKKRKKKTDNPREGWEDGTPPLHRDFKERPRGV